MIQTASAPALSQERPVLHHNNFDFLRFLLAVGVIISHAYPLLLGVGTPEPLAKLLSMQADLGKICVEGFFVISGFLVTGSYMRSSTALNYLTKRSLRIFPGLAAALLVCIFVVAPLGGASFPACLHHKGTWKLLSILFMHDVNGVDRIPGVFAKIPFSDVIGPAWTIRYEFGCYLLVMALGLMQVFRQPKVGPIIIGMLFAVTLGGYHHWGVEFPGRIHWYGSFSDEPRFVTYFLAGSLACLLRERIPHSRLLALLCAAALLLCHSQHFNVVLPFAGTYLLLYLAFSKSVRLPLGGGKVDLSYGLYLYGWPVEQLLIYHFGARLSPIMLIVIALPLSAALAWTSWTCVERPCLRLKTRMPRRTETRTLPIATA